MSRELAVGMLTVSVAVRSAEVVMPNLIGHISLDHRSKFRYQVKSSKLMGL